MYLSRSESLKKAQRKYRVNNREKMSEYSKKYYDKIKKGTKILRKNKAKRKKNIIYEKNKMPVPFHHRVKKSERELFFAINRRPIGIIFNGEN